MAAKHICIRCGRELARKPDNRYHSLCDSCRFIIDNMAVNCNEP